MSEAREVRERLVTVRARIAEACRRVGRDPSDVVLLGASKRQPVETLRAAHEAGLVDFGENRVQEAEEKRARLPDTIRWHLIGPLQSNKARKAVELFDVIHTIDRLKIARVLQRELERVDRRLPAFVEVNLGREESKHGFDPDDVLEAMSEIRAHDRLAIVGLMAIPPFDENPAQSRAWFRELRELRDQLRASLPRFPGALSMGMSSDYPIAVEEGATHVRVGTALFGPRPD